MAVSTIKNIHKFLILAQSETRIFDYEKSPKERRNEEQKEDDWGGTENFILGWA